MAFTPYHNITGSLDYELIAVGERITGIKSIMITNTKGDADVTVSLFIQDDPLGAATSTFYIIQAVVIPVGASLLLDNQSALSFNNSKGGYGLYLTTGATASKLDVMINR